jgi:AcrR family transcriptional regulator
MSDRALNPRKAPRQKRAQATVKAILQATAQLLIELGYRKTSTNRIAERAGVSVGSLYQYFPNRESIVIALFEDLANQQMAVFEAGIGGLLESQDGDVGLDEAVRGLIHAIFATRTVEPELSRILLEEMGWTEHVNLVGEWTARATALVAAALRHPDAEIRAVDPDLAAYIVVQAAFGVLYGPRSPALMNDARFEEELVHLITNYLAPVVDPSA